MSRFLLLVPLLLAVCWGQTAQEDVVYTRLATNVSTEPVAFELAAGFNIGQNQHVVRLTFNDAPALTCGAHAPEPASSTACARRREPAACVKFTGLAPSQSHLACGRGRLR